MPTVETRTSARRARASAQRGAANPIAIATIALACVGLAAGAWFLFGRSSGGVSELAEYVPETATGYVEVSDVKGLIKGLSELGLIEQDKVKLSGEIDEQLATLAKQGGVDEKALTNAVHELEAMALFHDEEGEAVLMKFGDLEAVHQLLSAKPFEKGDVKVDGGVSYKAPGSVIVLFEEQSILVGTEEKEIPRIAAVVAGEKPNLKATEHFKAMEFSSESLIHGFAAAPPGEERPPELAEYLEEKKEAYVAGELGVSAGGTWTKWHINLPLKKEYIEDLPENPPELHNAEHVAQGTTAYLSLAIPHWSRKDFQEKLHSKQANLDSKAVSQAFTEGNKAMVEFTGATIEDYLDALDGEISISLAEEPGLHPLNSIRDLTSGHAVQIHVRVDGDKAEKLFEKASAALVANEGLGERYSVEADDKGISMLSKSEFAPSVRIALNDDMLAIVAGDTSLMKTAEKALGGDEVLSEVDTYKKTMAQLGSDNQAVLWVDSGSLLKEIAEVEKAPGSNRALVDLARGTEYLVASGDSRITTGFAAHVTKRGDLARLDFKTSNVLPVLMAAGLADIKGQEK